MSRSLYDTTPASIEVLPQLGEAAVIESLTSLSLGLDQYIVLGGANKVLRGIKPLTEDVDLLVSNAAFEKLASSEGAVIKAPPVPAQLRGATNQTAWVKTVRNPLPVSATTSLGDGYYPMTFDEFLPKTELVSGFPCLSLEDVRASKEALQRPKDVVDLDHIARFTGRTLLLPAPTILFPHLIS